MTQTEHGHHIPGSPTDDETDLAVVDRCGGCQHCPECYQEWAAYKQAKKERSKYVGTPMRMGANAAGNGLLRVKQLRDMLVNLPDEAELIINSRDDQRDGKGWSISAQWGQDGFENRRGTRGVNIRAGEDAPPTDEHFGPYGVGVGFPGDH